MTDGLFTTTDRRFAVGAFCTWHDFLNHAIERRRIVDGESAPMFCCPFCRSEVTEVDLADWLNGVAAAERKYPGSQQEAMALWSRGRCFPDYDTLINAYRQAMEE